MLFSGTESKYLKKFKYLEMVIIFHDPHLEYINNTQEGMRVNDFFCLLSKEEKIFQ